MSSSEEDRVRSRAESPRHGEVESPFLAVTLLATALLVVVALWLQLPFANGPAEWEWPYRGPISGAKWLIVLVPCLALIPALRLAGSTFRRLLLVTILGWGLSLCVLAAEPGGMERVIRSLVSRHVFSYVFDSGQFSSVVETVEAYPAGVAGLSMHTRTHPPGPLLAIRLLDGLVPAVSPRSMGWIETAREALDEEVRKVRVRRRPVPAHLPSAATVVVLALLLPAVSALAAVPLFLVGRDEGLVDSGALVAAALWSSVPARSLFTPSLDQAIPVLLLLAVWLAGRRRLLGPVVGGGLWGIATLLSYGLLAAAPLVLWRTLRSGAGFDRGGTTMRRALARASALTGGFVAPWLGLVLVGFAPWTSFVAAMGEHRAMVTSGRTYATWLAFNPWDFLLFVGAAVMVLAVWDLGEGVAGSLRGAAGSERGLALLWWLVLLALLASGTVRGEAGRIWLFLMPFACLFAARALSRRRPALTAATLALQGLVLLSLTANLGVVA